MKLMWKGIQMMKYDQSGQKIKVSRMRKWDKLVWRSGEFIDANHFWASTPLKKYVFLNAIINWIIFLIHQLVLKIFPRLWKIMISFIQMLQITKTNYLNPRLHQKIPSSSQSIIDLISLITFMFQHKGKILQVLNPLQVSLIQLVLIS